MPPTSPRTWSTWSRATSSGTAPSAEAALAEGRAAVRRAPELGEALFAGGILLTPQGNQQVTYKYLKTPGKGRLGFTADGLLDSLCERMAGKEASPGSERATWPSFLRGADAQEIHGRLSQGDPLRLLEASTRRLRELWFLLDPERTYHRALGVCAKAASREDPPDDLNVWTRAKIDLAIEQLVQADLEAERAHPELLTEEEKAFPLLTQSLMLEPGLVRAASVAFNSLDALPRRAFFELLIEGRDVVECIESGPWDEDGLYHAIQEALATVSLDVKPEPPDDQQQGKKR